MLTLQLSCYYLSYIDLKGLVVPNLRFLFENDINKNRPQTVSDSILTYPTKDFQFITETDF